MKLFFLISLVSLLLPVWAQSDDYPGRATYPKVNIYKTSQLNQSFNDVIIIDVRSSFEFKTLHVNNAVNIPLNSRKFVQRVKNIQNEGKHIVFYCNGHSCFKSYKAARKARKAKIPNIFAYDSGVFDWANAHPEKATLLGNTPIDTTRLLGKQDLKKYMLDPAKFTAKINDNSVILDIREPAQRGLLELYPYRQQNISMDEQAKLVDFLKATKTSGKTLLVYDEAGKQVRWLQYYLEDIGISKYFFMDGGVRKFFNSINK